MPRRKGRRPKNYDPSRPHMSYYLSIKQALAQPAPLDPDQMTETPNFNDFDISVESRE